MRSLLYIRSSPAASLERHPKKGHPFGESFRGKTWHFLEPPPTLHFHFKKHRNHEYWGSGRLGKLKKRQHSTWFVNQYVIEYELCYNGNVKNRSASFSISKDFTKRVLFYFCYENCLPFFSEMSSEMYPNKRSDIVNCWEFQYFWEHVVAQYRRILIHGLLLYCFTMRMLKKLEIGIKHLTL